MLLGNSKGAVTTALQAGRSDEGPRSTPMRHFGSSSNTTLKGRGYNRVSASINILAPLRLRELVVHVCIRRVRLTRCLFVLSVILMFVPLIIFALGSSPRYTIAFRIPKAHGESAFGRPSSRRCTISRDSTLLRLWNEVFWGARFIPAIGVLLASKHRSQVILFREDF